MTTKNGLTLLALVAMGVSMLLISIYLLLTQIYFIYHAKAFDAPIVEVNNELVARGKGSVSAYVPVVEVFDEAGNKLRVKVATSDEEPVYHIGDKMPVLCDLSSMKCTKDSLLTKWGNFTATFLLSIVFLAISLRYYGRHA
jgi:hypothetical protein